MGFKGLGVQGLGLGIRPTFVLECCLLGSRLLNFLFARNISWRVSGRSQ